MITPNLSAPVRLQLRRIPDPDRFQDFSCLRKSTYTVIVDVAPLPDGSLLAMAPELPSFRATFPDFEQLQEDLPYEIERFLNPESASPEALPEPVRYRITVLPR
ncbi:MAG: hypothetical protein ABT940_10270 [Alphaproteobacteria bacterium]